MGDQDETKLLKTLAGLALVPHALRGVGSLLILLVFGIAIVSPELKKGRAPFAGREPDLARRRARRSRRSCPGPPAGSSPCATGDPGQRRCRAQETGYRRSSRKCAEHPTGREDLAHPLQYRGTSATLHTNRRGLIYSAPGVPCCPHRAIRTARIFTSVPQFFSEGSSPHGGRFLHR